MHFWGLILNKKNHYKKFSSYLQRKFFQDYILKEKKFSKSINNTEAEIRH